MHQDTRSRRRFLRHLGAGMLALPAIGPGQAMSPQPSSRSEVFFTNGFKTMEVGTDVAVLWTRLCAQQVPNPIVHARREEVFRHPVNFDEHQAVESMDGGVRGAAGEVQFTLHAPGQRLTSGWLPATEDSDFTAHYDFRGLRPATQYRVEVQGRLTGQTPIAHATGSFSTLPPADLARPLNLVTSTCQYFWSFDHAQRGFRTYDSMRELQPDIYIHTGDYVYYDKPGPLATSREKARHKWHAMDGWPSLREFYADVPVCMIKDDHDLLVNDVHPGMHAYGSLTYEDGLKLWYENVPLPDEPYRTVRWGRDVEIWLVEGREFRTANHATDGPEKSVWGEEQKRWLVETVNASDATFKLLFSATPIVGPDRPQKKDNHANAVYQTEGAWLRRFLGSQKNLFVVNGDRHWQYVSRDPETGLTEFGSGPVSDFHAQGWDPHDKRPEHRFLRVRGGFLQIQAGRQGHVPFLRFVHRDVSGNAMHEEYFRA